MKFVVCKVSPSRTRFVYNKKTKVSLLLQKKESVGSLSPAECTGQPFLCAKVHTLSVIARPKRVKTAKIKLISVNFPATTTIAASAAAHCVTENWLSSKKTFQIMHKQRQKYLSLRKNRKQMNGTLKALYGLRVFTLNEACEVAKVERAAMAKTMQRYRRMGIMRKVRRNLHCMNDLASGNPLANKYEVASHISPTSRVAYHTALEFHGLAHQPFFSSYVMSKSRFATFEFDGCQYQWCGDTIGDAGIVTPLGNGKVKVTNLERTIIDCIDRIDRAGGVEELLHCMESVLLLNEQKLTSYLALYGKAFLYQKTGYLLERIKGQAHISAAFIEMCKSKGCKAVKRLTNGLESDTYLKQWNLYVPHSITVQANNELI